MTISINFTPGEARALLHRLESWDCICEVFADTEGLEHLASDAAGRTSELARELQATGAVTVDADSELDREILVEAIEGSTWPAIHDPEGNTDNTRQAHTAAVRCLASARDRIAATFGMAPSDIDLPRA